MTITLRIPITGTFDGTTLPPAGARFVLNADGQYVLTGAAPIVNIGSIPFHLFSDIGFTPVRAYVIPGITHNGGAGATKFGVVVTSTDGTSPVAMLPSRTTDPQIDGRAGATALPAPSCSLSLTSNGVGAQVVVMYLMPLAAEVDLEGLASIVLAPPPTNTVQTGSLYYKDNVSAVYATFYPWTGPRAVIERVTLVTNAAVAVGDLTVYLAIPNGAPAQTLTLPIGSAPGDSVSVVPALNNIIQQGEVMQAYQGGANTTAGDSTIAFQWRPL